MGMKWIPQGYPLVAVWYTIIPGERDGYDEPDGRYSMEDHAGMTDKSLRSLVATDYVAFWQVDPDADPREVCMPVTVNGTLLGPECQPKCGMVEDRDHLIEKSMKRLIGQRDYALARCEAKGWTPTGWSAPPTKAEIRKRRGPDGVKS